MPDVRGLLPQPPEPTPEEAARAKAALMEWADDTILAQQRSRIERRLAGLDIESPSRDWPAGGAL